MSILDVAREAGVSHTTVSRVINNHPSVSPRTASRVRAAMQKINYTPPVRRRGPRRANRTGIHLGNVGLLVLGVDGALGPVFTQVLRGVESALSEEGLQLMLGQVRDPEHLPPMITEGTIDGLLIYGDMPVRALQARLERYPVVWLMTGGRDLADWGDRVQPDNDTIGSMAVDYLVRQGHGNLAIVTSSPKHRTIRQRCEAFMAAAAEAEVRATMVVEDSGHEMVPLSLDLDAELVESLVDRLVSMDPMPTGIFVPSDRLIPPVYRALRRHGLEPYREVTLISCNNDSILDGLDPRPATLDVQAEKIGRQAVSRLIARMKRLHDDVRVEEKVAPKLIYERCEVSKENGALID